MYVDNVDMFSFKSLKNDIILYNIMFTIYYKISAVVNLYYNNSHSDHNPTV